MLSISTTNRNNGRRISFFRRHKGLKTQDCFFIFRQHFRNLISQLIINRSLFLVKQYYSNSWSNQRYSIYQTYIDIISSTEI